MGAELGTELEAELARSAGEQRFLLHYQPIFELDSGAITGAEALVRWRHPERGLLLPEDFIPLAESTGHILSLGRWVLREACRTAAAWSQNGAPNTKLQVSVNLSPVQLRQPEFAEEVVGALRDAHLDPQRLVLEITETVLVEDTAESLQGLNAIKDLGVRLAVDDFGTGYSSPGYLERFPFDVLKIAKPFVDSLGAWTPGLAVTEEMIELGKSHDLQVIAEGIELPDQRALLLDLGCELGQGYDFSPPVEPEKLDRMLSQT